MKSSCIICCCYKIEDNIIKRFLEINKNLDCDIVLVSDRDLNFYDKYIIYKNQEIFNFSKTLNFGIKNSLNYNKIVKTDIDIYIPDNTFNKAIEITNEDSGTIFLCSNCNYDSLARQEKIWPQGSRIRNRGYGALFSMTNNNWIKLFGYNENLYGWGGEDNDLYNRATKIITVSICKDYPLFHINHESRNNSFFPIMSKQNIKKSKLPYEQWS